MPAISLAPKSIQKFKKRNAYNSKYETGVAFSYHDLRGVHSSIVISMDKKKDGNSFAMKIALDSKSAQGQTEKVAAKMFDALFPYASWANQWATSGGMLYRIWPSKTAGKSAEPKIARAIKHIVLFADKIVDKGGF